MKIAVAVLKIVIGIAILAWLIAAVDWRLVVAAFRRCDPFWLALGFAAFLVAIVPAAARLQATFRHANLPFAEAMKLTLGSYVFHQLLPGGIGGDAYRTVRLKAGAGGWAPSIGLIFFERAMGALTLIVPALLCAFFSPYGSPALRELRWDAPLLLSRIPALAAVLLAVVLLAGAVYAWRVLPRLLAPLRDVARHVTARMATAVAAWSLVFHALRIAGAAAFIAATGYRITAWELTIVLALALLASMLPISLGALGVRESILVYALGASDIPSAEALTVALLMRLVLVALGAIGAITLSR